MYWHDENDKEARYQVPDDVIDLVFRLDGKCIAIDHAQLLANEIAKYIPGRSRHRIGIHQIRVAESGNGWMRPDQSNDLLQLSRRTKLTIRVCKEACEDIKQLCGTVLNIGGQQLLVGESKVRKLSDMATLFTRGIVCSEVQSEAEFLSDVAAELLDMNIAVEKMICGTSRFIEKDSGRIFARSLMIADLPPEDSVTLQRRGIGSDRLLGCGLFIPHRGINAIYSKQE